MNQDENDRILLNIHGAEGGADEEVEFGDFEGFEGGGAEGGIQVQAAPSPWATFPDLLPVQTSPATPADDAQGACGGGLPSNEGWSHHRAQSEPPTAQLPPPLRMLNPPDVSLGSRPPRDPQPHIPHERQRQLSVALAQISDLERQLAQSRRQCSQLTTQVNELRAEQERRVQLPQNNSNQIAMLERMTSSLSDLTNEVRELRSTSQHFSSQLDNALNSPALNQRITNAVQQALSQNRSPAAVQRQESANQPAGTSNSLVLASGDVPPSALNEIRQELHRHSIEQRELAIKDRKDLLETLSRAILKSCKLSDEPNGEAS